MSFELMVPRQFSIFLRTSVVRANGMMVHQPGLEQDQLFLLFWVGTCWTDARLSPWKKTACWCRRPLTINRVNCTELNCYRLTNIQSRIHDRLPAHQYRWFTDNGRDYTTLTVPFPVFRDKWESCGPNFRVEPCAIWKRSDFKHLLSQILSPPPPSKYGHGTTKFSI